MHEVTIERVGAYSPLGLTAVQTAMCARASKLEPRSTHLRNQRGRTIGCAVAPGVWGLRYGPPRWRDLAAPALREIGTQLPPETPLVLALPEDNRPDAQGFDAATLARELMRRAGLALKLHGVHHAGRAGAAAALEEAARLSASHDAVVVGAVDSLYHPDVLETLDRERRLLGPSNLEGVIPSEGAAFCLVRPKRCTSASWRVEIASSEENDEPNIGAAMTTLLRGVASDKTVFAHDASGERIRAREWHWAAMRNDIPQHAMLSLPRKLGDMGAATGLVALAICAVWLERGCAPAPAMAVALHSDDRQRGLLRIRKRRAA